MIVNSVAENILGTIGTICWTGQLIPQVWKSWREHSTAGLSHWLVLIWGIASLFLGVYAVIQNFNIPLIVQPQLFGFLSLCSWGQCLYYDKGKSRKVAFLIAGTVMVLVGALEVAMVFAIRPSMNQRAIAFFGIFSSVLISAGLLPQYWEIIKRQEVIGISIPFLIIDILGGVFSDLSLVFREKFDVLAAIAYTLVIVKNFMVQACSTWLIWFKQVLDGIIIIAATILNPRARKRRKREAENAFPHMREGAAILDPSNQFNSGTPSPIVITSVED
ncbi:PQ loop repeat-domain-containing protein [Collybia nuda]|uniref:PQ loop repeat-domain-containing protein n=1 Tax=Collybia nuda TaxID=64659 RepID=A0A9P5Y642_9AGAR|nr:PQ loop repeat-domain-containing protein [Collybia nuda]